MLAGLRQRLNLTSFTTGAAALGAIATMATTTGQTVEAAAPASAGALDPTQFKAFKLAEKQQLTHNTLRLRFALPEGTPSGMFVASCLVTKCKLKDKDGKEEVVIRPYTPTSAPDALGYMDLVVKVYAAGKMSKHMGDMAVGDVLEMKGPIAKYPYKANCKKAIGMVAGGTGITPMLQVIEEVLRNPADKTKLKLMYANVTEADIILRDRLDALAAKHPDRFSIYYVVDTASGVDQAWKGGLGRISAAMLKAQLPPPSDDNIIFVCGPPGMMAAISGDKAPDKSQGELSGALKDLGYSASQVYKF